VTTEPTTTTAYCPGCNHQVRLTVTTPHGHAQANLPDGSQVVCLDFGEGCSEGTCPLTGRPGIVMGVRLARAHVDHEWKTVKAQCEGCGFVAELEVLDARYAICPLCDTTNSYVVIQTGDEGIIAVTGGANS
jgi:Zn finger protein HypA/HybF involved in hydrogenase expression